MNDPTPMVSLASRVKQDLPKRLFNLVLVFLVISPILPMAMANPSSTQEDISPRLHADRMWIKDGHDNVVRLVGAAVYLRWVYTDSWKRFDPLSYIDETPEKYDVYKETGANFLRVQLNPWLWNNAHSTYVRALDTLVKWCNQRKIMMVLTLDRWNDGHGDWTEEQRIDFIVSGAMERFMVDLAERYKTENYVIGLEISLDLQLGGKPIEIFWASYRGLGTPQKARSEYRDRLISAIRAIHSVAPDYLVFVYPSSDDELKDFIVEAPINEPNVVYCIMRSIGWDKGYWPYAEAYYSGDVDRGYALMETAYRSWLLDAACLGYPVILMETMIMNDLPNPTRYVADLLALFRKYELSICWWAFERDDTQRGRSTLFLLQDTVDRKPTLSLIGSAWANGVRSSETTSNADSNPCSTKRITATMKKSTTQVSKTIQTTQRTTTPPHSSQSIPVRQTGWTQANWGDIAIVAVITAIVILLALRERRTARPDGHQSRTAIYKGILAS